MLPNQLLAGSGSGIVSWISNLPATQNYNEQDVKFEIQFDEIFHYIPVNSRVQ
jgi:hypothetical protein